MIPKGTLLIIGGAVDQVGSRALAREKKNPDFKHFEILRLLLKGKKKVEVITTASKYPMEVKERYRQTFDKLGFENTGFISITKKAEADESEFLDRIEEADAIFFSGGNQSQLLKILGGTPFMDVIVKRYFEDENFVVAGTSAGAMVMSKIMIYGGGTQEVVFRNDLKITTGFGLLEHCIIDSHFIKRGRFGRLAHAVILNPGQLGIGLGDDTALLIKNGEDAECLGSGAVVIIDSANMGQSNIADEEDECGVFVENLKVHLLVKGCRFNLKSGMIANPARKGTYKCDGK